MFKTFCDKASKKLFGHRVDDNHIIFYYKYSDFPGLISEDYSFQKPDGTTLKGHFYSYDNCDKKNLVIFCHGIGGGHRSYLKEIEYLCSKGLKVYAFDYQGTFESEGKDLGGFSEPLLDLNILLNDFKNKGLLKNKRISLIGHSWGGYAVSNILNYYDEINNVVAISAPISFDQALDQTLINSLFRKRIAKAATQREALNYPRHYNSSAIAAYKKTRTRVLIIHSKDDEKVLYKSSVDTIKKEVGIKENIHYIIVDGRNHNPTYTTEAVKYLDKTFKKYNSLDKKKTFKNDDDRHLFFKDIDWNKMTTLDPKIMDAIVSFIKTN